MKAFGLSLVLAFSIGILTGCSSQSEADAAIEEMESITAELVDMAKSMDREEAMKSEKFQELGKQMQAVEARLTKMQSELTDEQKDRLKKLVLSSKEEVDEAWN